jgi:signal transduction histidine kinase
MVTAGFGPVLSRLSEVEGDLPQTIGEICRVLPIVLFLHVFLAYPSGWLERRFEAVLITIGYGAALGSGFIALLLGLRGQADLIEIAAQPTAAAVVVGIGRIATIGVALTGLALLIRRARLARPPFRRWLLVACFGFTLASLSLGLLARTFAWPFAEPVKWVAFGLVGVAPLIFLAAFTRSRLARSAVGDLFVELRSEPAPGELRDAIARALRDPSLDLVYWLQEYASYADLDGRAVELEHLDPNRAVTYIDQDGVHVAALVHAPQLKEEPELLDAVTAAAVISLENDRLHAELRARLAELRGSRARISQAGQKERQRLERNLHDGAQQRLIALSLELRLLEEDLDGDATARGRLGHARKEIATSLEELRDVARGIHPAVVSAHGLEVALEQLAARAPVPVRVNVAVDGRLPEALEVAAYYVVAESLANIAKHSQAKTVRISIAKEHDELVVEIVDDGIGGADPERGSGLRGLADRVETLNGRLRVWTPRGGGTRVKAEIPCA